MKAVILSLAVLLAGCLAWAIVMTVLWSKEADKSKQEQMLGWHPYLPLDISALAADRTWSHQWRSAARRDHGGNVDSHIVG